jgi:hypothetical protein
MVKDKRAHRGTTEYNRVQGEDEDNPGRVLGEEEEAPNVEKEEVQGR